MNKQDCPYIKLQLTLQSLTTLKILPNLVYDIIWIVKWCGYQETLTLLM